MMPSIHRSCHKLLVIIAFYDADECIGVRRTIFTLHYSCSSLSMIMRQASNIPWSSRCCSLSIDQDLQDSAQNWLSFHQFILIAVIHFAILYVANIRRAFSSPQWMIPQGENQVMDLSDNVLRFLTRTNG